MNPLTKFLIIKFTLNVIISFIRSNNLISLFLKLITYSKKSIYIFLLVINSFKFLIKIARIVTTINYFSI